MHEAKSLDGQFHQLLPELESWLSLSARTDDKTSGSRPGHKILSGRLRDLEHWKREWRDCRTDFDRTAYLAEVRKFLRACSKGQADEHGQVPALTAKQKRYRLLESGEFVNVGCKRAAEALKMEPLEVSRARSAAGQNPRNGRAA